MFVSLQSEAKVGTAAAQGKKMRRRMDSGGVAGPRRIALFSSVNICGKERTQKNLKNEGTVRRCEVAM